MIFATARKTQHYHPINDLDNGHSEIYETLSRMFTVAVENDLWLWLIAFEILIRIDLYNFLALALYVNSHSGIT